MKDDYSISVVELLEGGKNADLVLKNLKQVLKNHGHEKLYPSILRGVVKELEQRDEKTSPSVHIRKEKDASLYKQQIEASLQALGAEKQAKIVTDETLVGGFVADYKHNRIDHSYKRVLLNMYQKLTN